MEYEKAVPPDAPCFAWYPGNLGWPLLDWSLWSSSHLPIAFVLSKVFNCLQRPVPLSIRVDFTAVFRKENEYLGFWIPVLSRGKQFSPRQLSKPVHKPAI